MSTLTNHLARLANSANVLVSAITVNSSAITSVNVGGLSINSSGIAGDINISGNLVVTGTGGLVLTSGAGLSANGSIGTAGQVLTSNATAVYWSNPAAGGVTSVATGNGLTGGAITTTGTLSVLANNGITANATGLFVNAQTPLSVNSSGLYLSTSAGNGSFSSGISAITVDSFGRVTSVTGSAGYVTSSGVTSLTAGNGLSGGTITTTGTVSVLANSGITSNSTGLFVTQGTGTVVNATGVHVNSTYIGTLTANNSTNLGGQAAAYYTNATNISTGTLAEARLPYRMDQNVTTTNNVTFNNMTLTGNLTVSGNVTVIGANNLSIVDNMIYLNSNNTTQNVDLGIAGNYNTTGNSQGYAHTGFFRDASDGIWKVFDGYTPEPDANVNIDTSNTSFQLANFQAKWLYAGNTSANWLVANNTGVYHTGTVNAASHTVGSNFIANSTGIQIQNGATTANTARHAGIKFWTDGAFGAELHYGDASSGHSNGYATAIFGRKGDVVALRLGAYPASNTSQNTFSEYVTILNSGRVGIGTTSPQGPLHVNGQTSYFTSNSAFMPQILNWSQTADATGGYYILVKSRSAAGANVVVGDTIGTLLFSGYDTTNTVRNSSFVSAVVTAVNSTAVDSSLKLQSTGSTGFISLSTNIGEAARVTPTGNFGIGTSSPGCLVDVAGTSNVYNGAVGSAITTVRASGTGQMLMTGINSTGNSATSYAWLQSGLLPIAASSLLLNAWGGKVGIGTTEPRPIFEVSGSTATIAITNSTAAANNKTWDFITGASSFGIRTVNDAYSAASTAYLINRTDNLVTSHIWYTSNLERMRIDSSGRVGIGSTPNASTVGLTLGGTATGGTVIFQQYLNYNVASDVTSFARGIVTNIGTNAATFTLSNLEHFYAGQATLGANSAITNQVGYRAAANIIGATNNYGFYGDIPSGTGRWNFYAAGTADNYFAGNVGFGSTSPRAPISFPNTTSTAGTPNRIRLFDDGSTNLYGFNVSPGFLEIIAGTGGGVSFYTNGANERMRIDSSGNVGIGNTAPTNKLSVNGTTYLQANVTLNGGLIANGSIGTAGQVLTSNATTVYWSNPAAASGVTSVAAGTGLSGGTITTTGTISMPNIGPGAGSYSSGISALTLDAQGRVTAITGSAGYLTGITSGQVTTALGYTPYNATNPSGYITSSGSITGSAGSVGGLSVHSGRNNEANKVVRTDGSGYIQAGWINTDSGDSGIATRLARIYSSYDNYVRYSTLTDFKVHIGESAKNNYSRRIDFTPDANYHVGSIGHSGYGANETFHGGSAFFDIWGGTNYPSGMGHIHGFNALHYTSNSLGSTGGNAFGIQVAGQYNQDGILFLRGCSSGTFSAWRRFMTEDIWHNNKLFASDGNIFSNVSMRAPVFYDQDDTGYYCNPNGVSRLSGIQTTNRSGNWDTDFQNTPADSFRYGGDINSGTNSPTGGGWWVQQNFRHSNASNYWGVQVAWGWEDRANRLLTRNVQGGTFGAWYEYLNTSGLTFSGSLTMSGNITASSDASLKNDVQLISNAVDKVKQIRGVTFTRNDLEDKERRYSGIIAQEVEKVLPEVVFDDKDGIKNVAYGNMVGLLIEAIKEQQAQIEELKTHIMNTK